MTTITRTLLKTIRTDLNEYLELLGKEHGIAIKIADNITFNANQAKISVNLLADASEETNTDVIMFNQYRRALGVKAEALNATYNHGGNSYRVITLDMKKHKYPVIVERGGKRYKVALTHLPVELRD